VTDVHRYQLIAYITKDGSIREEYRLGTCTFSRIWASSRGNDRYAVCRVGDHYYLIDLVKSMGAWRDPPDSACSIFPTEDAAIVAGCLGYEKED
jgi:hypothetical protein